MLTSANAGRHWLDERATRSTRSELVIVTIDPVTVNSLTHTCVSRLGHRWFRKWLVACSAPSHYLNQCWFNVNCNLANKIQWNLKQNSRIFIQENAFENVVCKIAAILCRSQYVKKLICSNVPASIIRGLAICYCGDKKCVPSGLFTDLNATY